ncbi:hypothetical protein MMC16_003242 [Acarospora aff. strigata]|nr:hypothetical protein [Acarospora aff. strigata]
MFGKLFVVWLLPTILAAPTVDPLSPVQTLQKRAVTCTPTYGTKINPDDCREALKKVPETIFGKDVRYTLNAFSGRLKMESKFSNEASDARYRMPQYFGSEKSCTLGVSLHNPDATVNFHWDALKRELSNIVEKCIMTGGGQGGSSNTYAGLFDIAIWAEPLTDLEDEITPEAFCAAKPKLGLLECLNNCFKGGCKKISPAPHTGDIATA